MEMDDSLSQYCLLPKEGSKFGVTNNETDGLGGNGDLEYREIST